MAHQLLVGPVSLDIHAGAGVRSEHVSEALGSLTEGYVSAGRCPRPGDTQVSVAMTLKVADVPFVGREPTTRFQVSKHQQYASWSSFWDARLLGFDGDSKLEADIALSPLVGDPEFEDIFRMLLRIVASSAGVLENALMLHGCAMVRPEGHSAIVFLGPSGAGKTTMRTRLPGWRPLADDTVVVRQRDEVVEVCGTPFGGREGNARSGDWVPLEAIVFLSKGAEQLRL